MTKLTWRDDPEYLALVSDLLAQEPVQRLANYTQHHHSNRLDHSISVSYNSYLIAKKLHLNTRATARGGLLHDLFYYDWRTTKFNLGSHAFIHPRVALRNAEKAHGPESHGKRYYFKAYVGCHAGDAEVPRKHDRFVSR
jgi:Predicted HD superfamily hydrolase